MGAVLLLVVMNLLFGELVTQASLYVLVVMVCFAVNPQGLAEVLFWGFDWG